MGRSLKVETVIETRVVSPVEVAGKVYSCTEVRVEIWREWSDKASGVPEANGGEKAIAGILESLGVRFVPEKLFKGLRGVGGGLLRFDFGIEDGNRWLLIQYDGPHHSEVVQFEGMDQREALRAFGRTQEHDRRKNDFCKAKGYPFLRISYREDDQARYLVTSFVKDNLGVGSSAGSWRVSNLRSSQ